MKRPRDVKAKAFGFSEVQNSRRLKRNFCVQIRYEYKNAVKSNAPCFILDKSGSNLD